MRPYTRRGFSRRGLQYAGATFLLFPAWYPFAEEGRWRLPQVDDVVYYPLAFVVGVLFIVAARSRE